MLVLSRRVDEEILFPNLDIRIKILRSAGNRVRLGIDAPRFVQVARAECENPKLDDESLDSQTRHELRNRVNAVRLALELYDRQTNRGDIDSANRTFLRIVAQLKQADLDRECLSPTAMSVEGPKVLVVEDDPNERELLSGLLQMDGCRVESTPDGLGAIEYLKQGSTPDVVLLDMHMPRLDGKGTLAAIRNEWRDLLVFGISGSTPAENGITVGGPQGIDEWFQKPLNPGQLVAHLRQRLASSASVSA